MYATSRRHTQKHTDTLREPSCLPPRLGLRLELADRLKAAVAVGPAHAAGDLEEGVEVVLDLVGTAGPELARVVEDGRRLVVAALGSSGRGLWGVCRAERKARVSLLRSDPSHMHACMHTCMWCHGCTHQHAAGWFSASTNGCWQPLLMQVAVPSALRVQAGLCITEAAADLAALAASGLASL